MLKKLFFLLSILFVVNILFSQQSKDSIELKYLIDKAYTDYDARNFARMQTNLNKAFVIMNNKIGFNNIYYVHHQKLKSLMYINLFKFDSALYYINIATNVLQKFCQDSLNDQANVFRIKAHVLRNMDMCDSAAFWLQKVQKIQTNINASLRQKSITFYFLAQAFYCNRDYWQSIFYYQKSLEYFEINVDMSTSDIYQDLALCYQYLNIYDTSWIYLHKSLSVQSKFGFSDKQKLALLYNNFAAYFYTIYNIDSMSYYINKSVNLYESIFPDNSSQLIDIYNNMAVFYQSTYQYQKANDYIQKAIKIASNYYIQTHPKILNIILNLANNLFYLEEYSKALDYYIMILPEIEKTNDYSSVLKIYTNIAFLYEAQKNYDKASVYWDKCYEIVKNSKNFEYPVYLKTLNSLAQINNLKQNKEQSLYLLQTAKQEAEKFYGNKSNFYAKQLALIGDYYFIRKSFDTAFVNYKEALDIFVENKNYYNTEFISLLLNIAAALQNVGDYAKALEFYNYSIIYNTKQDFNVNKIEQLLNIKTFVDRKLLMISLLGKINLLVSNQVDLEIDPQKRYQIALKQVFYADTLIDIAYKQIQNEKDKYSIAQQADSLYNYAVRICFSLSEMTNNYSEKEKYKKLVYYFTEKNKNYILLQTISRSKISLSGLPNEIADKYTSLKQTISFYNKKLEETNDNSLKISITKQLIISQDSLEKLNSMIENNFPKYSQLNSTKIVEISKIQSSIPKSTIILSYLVVDNKVIITATTNTKLEVFQKTIPYDFAEKVTTFVFAISNISFISEEMKKKQFKTVNFYVYYAKELFDYLFPSQLQEFLEENKIENLIIIPHSYLTYLPFEVLFTENYEKKIKSWSDSSYFAQMPFLINKYNISYHYSASLLYYNNFLQKERNKNISVFSIAPVFSGNPIIEGYVANSLFGSKEEVLEIEEICKKYKIKVSTKLNKQANEMAIKNDTLANYTILHISTHGLANEQSPDSSLLLFEIDKFKKDPNDGLLMVYEIYKLQLNADLVVMSACQTALGKIQRGEGIIGLTRAFMYAGAKNVISSLWSVSDWGTKTLMINFYTEILQNKKENYSKALQKAKIQMIKEGYMPFMWAPFVLIGF